jgi:hypothetical protein
MKNLKNVVSFVGVSSVLCTSLLFGTKISKINPEEIVTFSTPINISQKQSTVFLVNNSQKELKIQVISWKVGLTGWVGLRGQQGFDVELGPNSTSGNTERLSFVGGVKGLSVEVPYGNINNIEIFGENNKKLPIVSSEAEPVSSGWVSLYAPEGSILEFRIEDKPAPE